LEILNASEEVARQIEKQAHQGWFKPEETLPPENDLMK
jgi:DNA-binding FadR family transcriptional regulator